MASLTDLATVAAARRGNISGPFEKLGHATATVGAAGGLLAAGQPLAAVGALLGAREVSRLGGAAGGLVDRMAGTGASPVFLRRGQAAAALRAAGVKPGDDAITATNAALATLNDPQARLNLSLGLPLDTPAAPPMPDPVQARGLNLAEQGGRVVEQQAVRDAMARGKALADAAGRQVGSDQDATATPAEAPSVAPVPWRPGDPPVGLSVLQRAAQRSRLAQLEEAAAKNAPASLAQRQVDSAALRASAALGAEMMTPSGPGADDSTAVAAAIAQAARRAAAVRRLAEQGGDAADRAAVGLPMRDPIPVNTPLRPNDTPLDGQSPVVRQAVARAARQSPQEAAQPAPSVPAGDGQGNAQGASGTLPAGWLAYVLSGLMRAGVVAKPSDVHAALDDLAAAGELSPQHVEALKGHRGPVYVPELLQRIASQTATRTGQADRLDAGLTRTATDSPATGSDREPIRNETRWQAAREDRKAHAENLAGQAERMGDHDLAVAVRKVAAEPTAAGKQAIATAYLESVKGTGSNAVLRRARAVQFLSGPLLKGV